MMQGLSVLFGRIQQARRWFSLFSPSISSRPSSPNTGETAAEMSGSLVGDGYTLARFGENFDIANAEETAQILMQTYGKASGSSYNTGLSVNRRSIEGSKFFDSSAGNPPAFPIHFHNEMAYSPRFPRYISFLMIDPAESGGCTTVTDNMKVESLLSESLKAKLRTLGVQYVRNLDDEADASSPEFFNSWQRCFSPSPDTPFDTLLHEKNGLHRNYCVLPYSERNRKRVQEITWAPAFHQHPRLGPVLFNSIMTRHGSWLDGHPVFDSFPLKERPYHSRWGDGTDFSDTEYEEISNAYKDATLNFSLQRGDLIVLDNLRMSHGRTPYTGSRRRLGVMVSDLVSWQGTEGGYPPLPSEVGRLFDEYRNNQRAPV
uniref:TauD/TfdA-like domain-containing protein n=1 Tax=Chromera velia CCMP2878 TaxID=1169474 RepID=A0A0G4I475_9ALVE|eukprot:Cvel_10852.t1-p1 / transcript=Cvel_10852.t1 / gene=Cvel_10852 / organism=Chromera_velia_CCMP2878 / gene_product=hypothetical protein / transcript_product=hypothetical protein / location=Cvel_scaffold664:46247-47362(+) / protein_length=372 / sequence_SO=supercontig / SO=protein_coding / is_pseudo=false